jgi:hypothetical protein
MSGHTPGPWVWAERHHGLFGSGKDNRVLDFASYEGMWLAYSDHQEANARLIAAAPDLYAAALEMVAKTGCADPDCCKAAIEQEAARAALAAAVAKAEGR